MSIFNYPTVPQKNEWKVKLFPHQLTAIWMMEEREVNQKRDIYENEDNSDRWVLNTNIGIYSDPTGYGKTLAMVGLLSRDNMKWNMNTLYKQKTIESTSEYDAKLTLSCIKSYKKINCSILLVNQSIITQWEQELNLLDVKYTVINSKKRVDEININDHTLLVVIPTMYNRLMRKRECYNIVWKRFIFDEPVNTHVPAMLPIKAGFYWFITATPTQLNRQSRAGHNFVRNVFNYWVSSRTINQLIVKNNIDYVKSSYVFPETNHLYHVCYQPVYNMCRQYIDGETSDMISAGNILGAIRRLGGNETSNIFELIKQKLLNKLEQKTIQLRNAIRHHNNSYIKTHNDKRLNILKQLDEIKDQYSERLQGECSICLDKLNKPVLVPCCQNLMCGECILEWSKTHNNCPLCRQVISHSNLVYIKDKDDNTNNTQQKQQRELTKPETILKIINNNKNGKFIVFSNYSETFQHIYSVLNNNNISYKELKGQIGTRSNIINKFKKGIIKVLFLNSKNNGAGINLQEATDIILYHELTDELKTQVIGRANRIGRKESLYVHHLL